MMSSRETFKTESIDLAAYLATAGFEPIITCSLGSTRALFMFEGAGKLYEGVVSYESGAVLPAKRLLNKRSWLFREASRVVREGVRHG